MSGCNCRDLSRLENNASTFTAVLWLHDEQHEAIFTVFFSLPSAADVCCVPGGVPQPGRAGCVSMFSRLPQEVSFNEENYQLVPARRTRLTEST